MLYTWPRFPHTKNSTETTLLRACNVGRTEPKESINTCSLNIQMRVHVAAQECILEKNPGKILPWSPQVCCPRALNDGIVDHIPVRVVTRPSRCCDEPGRNRLPPVFSDNLIPTIEYGTESCTDIDDRLGNPDPVPATWSAMY